jgi:hypothetical protein
MMAGAAYQLLIDCSNAACGAPHLRHAVMVDAAHVDDWEQVVSMAAHHGLLPSLTMALGTTGWLSVPPEVRQRLERRHQNHIRKTFAKVDVLCAICARFQEAGVVAASWKGPLLAQALYGCYVSRESGDLDFLMDPDELTVAASILKSMGFRRHCKTRSARLDRKVARLDGDKGFYRATDDIYVELHAQPMPARFTTWQNRREYLRSANRTPLHGKVCVLTLRPEDMLLSLVGHAIKHHWERLKWVQDIAMFVRRYEKQVDWTTLLAATRLTSKSRALVHSVALAQYVFGEQVPSVLQESPEWLETWPITCHIAQVLQLQERGHASEEETGALMHLLQPPGLARLHFMVKRAFEPQLCDFNDSFSRSPLLCKWHRMLLQTRAGGVFGRGALSLRKAAR